MNVNPILEEVLTTIGLPVFPDVYCGDDPEYIVYNYSDERPIFWVDDRDIKDLTTVQVHCFTRKNPQQYKPAIRRALRLGGFCIISTRQIYESDTKYHHITVEACIDGNTEV